MSASLTVTEDQLLQAIVDAANLYGWMVAHFRPALTGKGWRTPMQGDPGYPDLTLARNGVVIFLELKSEQGKLTTDQARWFAALSPYSPPNDRMFLVRPADLDAVLALLK